MLMFPLVYVTLLSFEPQAHAHVWVLRWRVGQCAHVRGMDIITEKEGNVLPYVNVFSDFRNLPFVP